MTNIREIAKTLGSLGGKARARCLSSARRQEIASRAVQTRWLSEKAVDRIRKNFRYVEAIRALRKVTYRSL